jgi:hypothetical protein
MIAADKTKPNPRFLREDPPSDMYAFGSVSAAVDGLPSNQQRTMATLVSANISGHSLNSAAPTSSSISDAKRFLKAEGYIRNRRP